MKASELRIGNHLHDREGRFCIVTKISEELSDGVLAQEFKAPAVKGPVTSLPNKPILITAEKLIDYGAKGRTNLLWISLPKLKLEMHFECHESGEIVTTLKGQFCDLILDRIEYVHELQNLYYALMKEELPSAVCV